MYALYIILVRLIELYELCIVVWCVMSWLPRTSSDIVETIRGFLGTVCEPYLGLFRKIIPPFSGIDFSPIVAIIVLNLVERFVLPIILY